MVSSGDDSRAAVSDTSEGQATRARAFPTEPKTVPRDRFSKWPAPLAAIVVLALVGGVAILATHRDEAAPKPVGAPTLRQLTHGTWEVLPSRPTRGLQGPTAVWTGRELLVWSTASDGGVALDPRTKSWKPIPPSGVVDGQQPIWAGDRMIVWAGDASDSNDVGPAAGAAYNPRSGHWTVIAAASIGSTFDGRTISPFAAVKVGRNVAVLGGPAPSAVLELRTGTWHGMPSPVRVVGIPPGTGAYWTGRQIVGLQGAQDGNESRVAVSTPAAR